jgi:hypothetical protein
MPVAVLDDLDGGNTYFTSAIRFTGCRRRRTLLLGLVSEHGTESDIADALDALGGGIELVVNDDPSPLVGLDTNGLEIEALCHWPSADCDEDDISLELRA